MALSFEGATRTLFYLLRLFVCNNKHAFLFQQQMYLYSDFLKGRMLETLGTNISSTKPLFTIKSD